MKLIAAESASMYDKRYPREKQNFEFRSVMFRNHLTVCSLLNHNWLDEHYSLTIDSMYTDTIQRNTHE